MTILRAHTLILLALALPFQSHAIDLISVYNLARDNDPVIRTAQANRLADFETQKQSVAALLPNLSARANTVDNNQNVQNSGFLPNSQEQFNSNSYSITLTQPLYRHDLFVALRQSDYVTQRAEADYQIARQDLIIRVSQRYFDVLIAEDTLQFAQAEKEATAKQLDDAKQRFDVGLVAITDVLEAQARYDLTVAQEITAQNDLANAREALSEITNQQHESLQRFGDTIPLLRPDPENVDSWVTRAEENNLQIISQRHQREIAKEEINRQRSGHYPTLDIVASRSNSVSSSRFGRETDLDTIGLELNVPLFQGGGVASRTRQARYRFQASQQESERVFRAVVKQTRNAYLGVIASIGRVNALKQAVISSEKSLEASTAGLSAGTRTIVDVLLTQRELFRARADYARSRYDYLLNTLRLKQAAGNLSIDDLQGINAWLQ